MTPLSDTNHPEVSELSDFTEGLLPRSRVTEVRRHLGACGLCAETEQSLREIQNLLGAVPGPPSMPADVAERIDAALAAEALLSSTAPAAREKSPRRADHDTIVSGLSGNVPGARTDDRQPTGPSILLSGPTGPSKTADRASGRAAHVSRETSSGLTRPGGRSRAGTGPGRESSGRRRRRTTIVSGIVAVAVIGVSVLMAQALSGPSHRASVAEPPATSAVATTSAPATHEFSAAQLQPTVDSLLADAPTAPTGTQPELRSTANATTGTNSPLIETDSGVPYCVRQGTGRSDPVLASEAGTYHGAPAYLLVLADPSHADQVQVYVISSDCEDSGPTAKGKILRTESYTR